MLVVVPIENEELISYEVDFSYRNFQESYELLDGRFHPVINMLLGLKSVAFNTNGSFSFKQEYDMQKSLMRIFTNKGRTSKTAVNFLEISLLSFGRLMSQVCAPCKHAFIELDVCRTQCPQQFVSRLYYDSKGTQSGKTCTQCLPEVNMEYNSDLKMCVCKKDNMMTDFGTRCNPIAEIKQPGKVINTGIQVISNINQECPIQGMIFIDSKCQCENNLEQMDNKCVIKCGPNSKREQKTEGYLCDTGYQWLSSGKSCSKKCQDNQVRDIKGVCVCSSGYVFSDSTKKCEKKAEEKQVTAKPAQIVQQEPPKSSSILKEKIKMLIDPKTPNYISSDIILDFFITPVIKKTQEQIEQLFEITFSDNKLAPPSIFLNQNENDLKQYRVFLIYRNNLPFMKFAVTIKIKDKNLGQDFLTLLLDPLNVPATYSRRRDNNFFDFGS